ncbi:glycosyltransferase [Luteibacter rhizovicinus]|nr:glycosyltransferase [Luteibacter rhizovicinus]
MVSVVMVTYNHARYISEAIEGIVMQRARFPFELIIGEDHSTDDTLAIVKEYQLRRPDLIRVLTADKNVGMRENADRCFHACRGKYIAFCEGDDFWTDPLKLDVQIDMLERDPEMTACHTDYDRQTRRGIRANMHRREGASHVAVGKAYEQLLQEWTAMSATVVYRKDVLEDFEDSPFNNKSWPFGDYNRLLYASTRGRFGYLPTSTAVYRKIRGSALNGSAANGLKMVKAVAECRELFLRKIPVATDIENASMASARMMIYRAAFFSGDRAAFEEAYRQLSDQGYAPQGISHKIRSWALSARLPLAAYRTIKNLIDHYVSALPR